MTTMKDRPSPSSKPKVHPVNEVLPAPRLLILGAQHLFIMYAGAVAVPLIVGPAVGLGSKDIAILVSADLLVSGIASVIQSVGISKVMGVRLPVVAGATFTVLNPMIIIANSYGGRDGLPYVYGALLISGIFGLLIAKPFSMILRFFPPLVTGTVIAMIGLSLIGADIGLIAGNKYNTFVPFLPVTSADGKTATVSFNDPSGYGVTTMLNPDSGQLSHIGLAAIVVLLIIVITRVFRGFIGQTAVLISVIIGSVIALPMGLLHFPDVPSAGWFGIAEPFHFGPPKFAAAAIISMCIVILVTYTESTADILAVAEMVDKDISPNDLARGLATDGLSAVLASFMNSFPDTAYAENVGLIGMTKVRSRYVVTVCGIFLIILGVIPKVGAIVSDLPAPVIGGAATVMFAMVTAIGIQTLRKVSYEDNHNLLVIAVAFSFGLIPVIQPNFYMHFPNNFKIIFGSAITSTVIVVFILNIIFNELGAFPKRREGLIGTAVGAGAVVAELGETEDLPESESESSPSGSQT